MFDISALIQNCPQEKHCRFVFPSDLAARNAAEQIARTSGTPIALDDYLAWDRFKELTLSGASSSRIPANGLVRRLFTNSLFEENAEAAQKGHPLFEDLIPPEWAKNYTSFIEGTAAILPVLGPLKKEMQEQSESIPYFKDLLFLSLRWEAFMDTKGLFEPGWRREAFEDHGYHWILFYPDLVEDWPEYETELSQSPNITIYLLKDIPRYNPPQPPRLIPCKNLGEELTTVARLIRYKLDIEQIPPNEIVISVPELETLRDRIVNTFSRFDIQVSIHAGLPLSNWPFGQLLQRLKDCASSKWSYDNLKVLLLDPRIPWKNKEDIRRFLEFGRLYRCVSGYEENGLIQDVWETSFERLLAFKSKRERYGEARKFWRQFKFDSLAILGASNFTSLRDNLLKFKTNLFDDDPDNQRENQVISRILEELRDLARTAERLGFDRIPSPFSLFLGHLRAETYVPQDRNDSAIQLYPYRVSAGISCSVHIIMNARQDSLSIPPRGSSLLPEPLRKLLHSDQRRLAELFIDAYRNSGEQVIFTMAGQGPKGFAIPHIALSSKDSGIHTDTAPGDLSPDPWKCERQSMSPGIQSQEHACTGVLDSKIFLRARKQESAWQHWRAIHNPERKTSDFRYSAIEPSALWPAVFERLVHDSTDPRLSPTDLSKAGDCPFAWLLSQGFSLEELKTEIETIEQREVGILYHDILENLFLRMKDFATRIRNADLPEWLRFADEECAAAIQRRRLQEGSFQDSVYDMLEKRIRASINSFIQAFLPEVEDAAIMGVEMPLSQCMKDVPLRLSGIADLVLLLSDGTLLLADFKTNYAPKPSELVLTEGTDRITNYQLAAYILMLEKDGTYKTSVAWFYSLDKREFTRLVAPERPKGTRGILPLTREAYQKELDSLNPFFDWIWSLLDKKRFSILPPEERGRCRDCAVRSVCRIPYTGED